MFRLGPPMSLVAVFAVVAVVVAALIGGRMIRDWNSYHRPSPAGTSQSEMAQLESRPIQLQQLTPNEPCPTGPVANGLYGPGPLGVATGTATTTAWGTYWYMGGTTETGLRGLILVRARDLRTNQPVLFVGTYAAGPIIGIDTIDASTFAQHAYMLLDTSHPPARNAGGDTYVWWPFTAGLAKGTSGCVGWQVDGRGFTETFVVAN